MIDADLPTKRLCSLNAADIDGDGQAEVFTGGTDGLFCCRSETGERIQLIDGMVSVGLVREDVDGNGSLEGVTGRSLADSDKWEIIALKPTDATLVSWGPTVLVADQAAGVSGSRSKSVKSLATSR